MNDEVQLREAQAGQAGQAAQAGRADPIAQKLRTLLSDPRVVRLITDNSDHTEAITNAAKCLCALPGAVDGSMGRLVEGVLKAWTGIKSGTIEVFLSYKSSDLATAREVKEALLSGSGGNLNIAMAPDDIPAGTKWRDWIQTQTATAHWFILLLPDPSQELDWCLFESGLFEGQMKSCDRLICLHHHDIPEVPDQISPYQKCASMKVELTRFLDTLYKRPNPLAGLGPLNIHAETERIAERIETAIAPPAEQMEHTYYDPFVRIELPPTGAIKVPGDLDQAIIIDHDPNATVARIFGLAEMPATWGKLIEIVVGKRPQARWLGQLIKNITEAALGYRFNHVQASFEVPNQEGKRYRPMLHCSTKPKGGAVKSILVLFMEDTGFSTTEIEKKAPKLNTLATTVRLAFRFRWEVLEPFRQQELKSADVSLIEEKLNEIETEADDRGVIDAEALTALFDKPAEKVIIQEMFEKWGAMRDPNQVDGTLDKAFKAQDGVAVSAVLQDCSALNKDFLKLSSRRFSELTAELEA